MDEAKIIINAEGQKEEFDRNKFCASLRATGAPEDVTTKVCDVIAKGIKPGASTTEIFREASEYLAKHNKEIAAKYNLKRGMQLLGPSGFAFEQFIEVLMQTLGYETQRGQMVQGACVDHEVDVIAKKEGEHIFIEAKYHNKRGIKTHVDDVMYADARFMDIAHLKEYHEGSENKHTMQVMTNTKFTSKAIKYATCRNMIIIGWNYPKGEGLADIIRREMLYPVTVLPSVGSRERTLFAQHNMMLARDLAPYHKDDLIKKMGISEEVAGDIIDEAHALVYGNTTN